MVRARGVEAIVGAMRALREHAMVQLSALLAFIPLALENAMLQVRDGLAVPLWMRRLNSRRRSTGSCTCCLLASLHGGRWSRPSVGRVRKAWVTMSHQEYWVFSTHSLVTSSVRFRV